MSCNAIIRHSAIVLGYSPTLGDVIAVGCPDDITDGRELYTANSPKEARRLLRRKGLPDEVRAKLEEYLVRAELPQRLTHGLPRPLRTALMQIQAMTETTERPAYIVGGMVRDALLGGSSADSHDLDVVIVGYPGIAMRVAEDLCRDYGGEVELYPQFGTATWKPRGASTSIDLITARSETYSKPGALPTIGARSDFDADIERRDFTVNTMAMRLDRNFGEFVDTADGAKDLAAKQLRVLHPDSFRDDPTRIWRGVRYEKRLGMSFAPETAALLQRDKAYTRSISGDRIRNELYRVFAEPNRAPMLARLGDLGVLDYVGNGIGWQADTERWFSNAENFVGDMSHEDRDHFYLALLLLGQSEAQRSAALTHLNPTASGAAVVSQVAGLWQNISEAGWGEATRPSEVVRLMRRFPDNPTTLLALRAVAGEGVVGEKLAQYATWKEFKTHVTGDTLKQMGLRPGPQFKTILGQLLDARLDGVVASEADEMAMVRRLIENGA
jgi:tRNA nucleotidyltransferase (CCA-adding enzyme)